MPLIDRLERKIGWIAIPGIVRILAGFQLLTYILIALNEGLVEVLALSPSAIMGGEVWRLASFVFIPPPASPLLIIIALWFMWFLGDILESNWGSFRLTLYLFASAAGIVAGAFLAYFLVGEEGFYYYYASVSRGLIWVSTMLFAVGVMYPEIQIMLMFVIPVKMKWLALFRGAVLVLSILGLSSHSPLLSLAVLLAISNFLVAFGPATVRMMRQRKEVAERRSKFERAKLPVSAALHRCATCGKTEADDEDLDFRVASDGEEYCVEHLPGRAVD